MKHDAKKSVLRCTACGTILPEAAGKKLACPGCGNEYPMIFGEVTDFAPVDGFRDSPAHSYTYSYSSRLYEFGRRSFLMKMSTGVSFGEERERLLAGLDLKNARTLLDAGCGTGIFSRLFSRSAPGLDVWGLDYSYSQLRRAVAYKRKENITNLRFVHGLAGSLPFGAGCFDRIVTVGAMQFFGDTGRFFDEVFRALEPGGVFFAVNYLSLHSRPSARPLARMAQKTAFRHGENLFAKDELFSLCEHAGFDVADYSEKGIVFFLKARKRSL